MALKDVTYNIGGRSSGLDLSLGKLPPQAIDLEEAVLGICMVDSEALLDATDVIKIPEMFSL